MTRRSCLLPSGVAVRQFTNYASDRLQDDEEVLHAAVEQNPLIANLDIGLLRANSRVIQADVIAGRTSALRSAAKSLQQNPSFICHILENSPSAVRHLPDELRDNVLLISRLVEKTPLVLAYVSPDVRDFVKQFGRTICDAVHDPTHLRTAPEKVTGNRDVMFAAVSQDWSALQHATTHLKSDRALVLEAVTQNGGALKFAGAKLNADRDLVLAAVKRDGSALKYASAELQSDRDLVLAAVRRDEGALKFAAAELRSDREVVVAANFKGRCSRTPSRSPVRSVTCARDWHTPRF